MDETYECQKILIYVVQFVHEKRTIVAKRGPCFQGALGRLMGGCKMGQTVRGE